MKNVSNQHRYSFGEYYKQYGSEMEQEGIIPSMLDDIVIIDTFHHEDDYAELKLIVIRANVPYYEFHYDGDKVLIFINKIVNLIPGE